MATTREERIALNEAAFRIANERMRGWEERHRDAQVEDYVCECADPDCREIVRLDRAAYEAVRADSRWFVVRPGHEIPDAETVVERHDGYAIVEKHTAVTATVTRTDPRRPAA
jgi:hypothetical protein